LQSGIVEQRVVLVLDHATLLSDQSGGSETVTVNMTLHAGELALIHVEHLQRALTFADTCAGLVSPAPGHVLFLNQDWARVPSDLANALRGRIGRVFATSTWLQHLSLLDNVVLRQLHHTRRPFASCATRRRSSPHALGCLVSLPAAPGTACQRTSSVPPVPALFLAARCCCWRSRPSESIPTCWSP
jgi:ABC-type uncharacterized transport system ATPase subunit